MPVIVERIPVHVPTYVIWMFVTMLIVPFGWLALWEIGYGEVLAQRPVAAVHHRISECHPICSSPLLLER